MPRGHVLLLDDEPVIVRSFARWLRSAGFEVDVAYNGDEGLALMRTHDFDAVLSDISMPGMDGITFLRSATAEHPHVPILLITGLPSIQTAIAAVEYGAFRYLVKPCDPQVLLQTMEKATRLRRLVLLPDRVAETGGVPASHSDALSRGPDNRAGLTPSVDRAMSSLSIAVQPIVRVTDGWIFGQDTFVRSDEPGIVLPDALFEGPMKSHERAGRLRTLRTAIARSVASAPTDAILFHRLHIDDLKDDDLASADSALTAVANRIVLELSERVDLSTVPNLRSRLTTLRELGFRFAVGDLGAGYAGLTSFAIVEPDIVRIDASIIRAVDRSSTKRKLVASLAELCRDLNLLVIANGVETIDERDVLIDLGVSLQQGSLFADPTRIGG